MSPCVFSGMTSNVKAVTIGNVCYKKKKKEKKCQIDLLLADIGKFVLSSIYQYL